MGEWFAKLSEIHWYTWLVVALLVAVFAFLTIAGKKTQWNSKRIAYAAMAIAISFVLSYIRM